MGAGSVGPVRVRGTAGPAWGGEGDAGLLPLPTGAEMRAREAECFGAGGLSERVVMEAAGRAAALAVARFFPDGPVAAAVGQGNNGGDAVVALRTLRAWGREVAAAPVAGAEIASGLAHGWEIPVAEDPDRTAAVAGVLIDGILGTGARGAPGEAEAAAIRRLNAAGRPIVALDGPSGVDLSSGAVEGEAVRARVTVTFGALKRGLLLFPGREHAGRILLAEVGFPPWSAASGSLRAALVTDRWAADRLPRRPADAHKGRAGIVAILAGGVGSGGAAIMAALGALRTGAGGARVISAPANRLALHAAVPEATFHDRDGDLDAPFAGAAALVAGPGMGTEDHAGAVLRSALGTFGGPVLLDADALTLLARDPALLTDDLRGRCVLTPHPGELARLLGTDTAAVMEDRFAAAAEAANRYGVPVLAKGTPSIVAGEGVPTLVIAAGHSGVATGGMGDTLDGIVGALLAAGAEPGTAAALGVHLAGRAAERAGRGRGLLPRDVAESLPETLLAAGGSSPASEPPFLLDLPEY